MQQPRGALWVAILVLVVCTLKRKQPPCASWFAPKVSR